MTPFASMPKEIDVRFRLQGAIREDRQTQCFVSYCSTLDLYSAGRTRMDAKKALTAAVVTYVRVCYDRGMLDSILKGKGFSAVLEASDRPTAKNEQFITVEEHASEYDDVFDFDIPLHLVAQAQSERPTCQP